MSKALIDFFKNMREENIFFKFFDCEYLEINPGQCKLAFNFDPHKQANIRGQIHGGAYMAISDCTMGITAYSTGKTIATLDYNCNFIKNMPSDSRVYSMGRVVHNGKTTVVVANEIFNEAGDLLFTARGTFYVLGPLELPEETDIN